MAQDKIPYLADLVASQRFISGEWFGIFSEGKIFNRYHQEVKGNEIQGYIVLGTKYNGHSVHIMKHRAIWIGAHGGVIPDDRLEVDHINADRLDNRIENLRLATASENCSNPNSLKKFSGENHYNSKITNELAEEIRRRYRETQHLPKGEGRLSQRRLAHEYGICQQQISKILREIAYKPILQEAKA